MAADTANPLGEQPVLFGGKRDGTVPGW